MDYRPITDCHAVNDADLTVAVRCTAGRNGSLWDCDERSTAGRRITSRPTATKVRWPRWAFTSSVLVKQLEAMHSEVPDFDFGKHVIPRLIGQSRVYACHSRVTGLM
jgi:ADP-glucose pyrophosphorylase